VNFLQQAMGNPFITLDDVTLRVGDTPMFEGTNWALKSSQHWTIIGPNGSGKSLLADAICRRIPVVHGRIRFFFDGAGKDARTYLKPGEILRISAKSRQQLLQRYAGYHQARWQSLEGEDAPTVAELLSEKGIKQHLPHEAAPVWISEDTRRQRRANAVELLGISHLLDRKIIHVSNGEACKVLIARALMQAPKLLIFDDPFSGLDSASRDMMRNIIEQLLAAGNFQVLQITSRGDEILEGMTHLLCVHDNCVIVQGPKKTILRTPFVGRFLAARKQTPASDHLQFPGNSENSAAEYTTLVEMKDTSVTYNGTPVLRNINWKMKQGEHWAVVGHNGAGKTTLLSLILGDNPQVYANQVTLFDKKRGSGESIWDIKRNIGCVSPELQLYYDRNITCRQVVCSGFFDSVGLYRTCSREQEQLADRWLLALEIEKLAERPFRSLSAGEMRMVLLARALVKNPALLVLDEPCQGLDAEHRFHIIKLLDQLCRQTSVSIIFVTHHFKEMPKAVTHVLRLEQGHIAESGKRKDVFGW
jgi:molybdate transport system ATP-binding protein